MDNGLNDCNEENSKFYDFKIIFWLFVFSKNLDFNET